MSGIILKLGEHCIEGTARKFYQRLVREILEERVSPEKAEDQLALLADFLQSVDFARLRSQHPDLDGRKEVEVVLSRTREGFLLQWEGNRLEVRREAPRRNIES